MVGITVPPGKREQLRLIGWLRWRLFVNGLRTGRGKANFVSTIIVGALIGVAVLASGPLVALGSWYALSRHVPLILAGELWFVFFNWLVFPIFISGFSAEADPASLLRFPLRYSTFALLALAHGLFDPVAITALYWILAILTGIAFASAGALLWAVPALAVFALLNVLLNRAMFAWLSRWMAQRRSREILAVVFVLAVFSVQLTGPLVQRYGPRARFAVTKLASVGRLLPPGMAAAAIAAGQDGGVPAAVAGCAGLLAYCGALGWLLSIRLRAEYRGESLSESRRETAMAPAAVRQGWNFSGLSPTVAALLEKDLRYLLRNAMAYFNFLAPLLVIVMLSLNRGGPHRREAVFMRSGAIFFPICVAYVILTLVNFVYNTLGYDGPGLPMLLAAPIRFRDVLAAKNLLYSMVFVLEVIAVLFMVQLVVGPPPLPMVAVTMAGALWVFLVNLTVGNLVSVCYPRKLIPGQMRRQQGSGIAVAAGMGTQILLGGLAVGVYLLSRWMGNLAWCVAAFLVFAGVAWIVYQRGLEWSGRIAMKRREVLMAELSRPG